MTLDHEPCFPSSPMYGIDFGTSNTVVTSRAGRPGSTLCATKLLDLGEGGIIPSLLYFEGERRPSVGHEAMTDYSAALARERGSGNLYSKFRFFQALKLALKDPYFEGTRIFGDYWKVENLVALFLREVKRRADESVAESGETPDGRLVLGRPVMLADDPSEDIRLEERFRTAARLAGFTEIDFVLEPVAAAVNVAGERQGTILVFDFGGGTLDISVARTGSAGIDILASVGGDLGGYLLNEDISRERVIGHFGSGGRFRTMTGRELEMPNWITKQVASFYALPLADLARTRKTVKDLVYDAKPSDKGKLRGLLDFLDRNLGFDLFAKIDEAKIELSESETSSIAYAIPPHIAFRENLTRTGFEALIARRVDAARDLVLKALSEAGMEAGEVRRVVRVGGSCRIPVFVRMLEELFPGRVEEGEVFTSIASGLLDAKERGLCTNGGRS